MFGGVFNNRGMASGWFGGGVSTTSGYVAIGVLGTLGVAVVALGLALTNSEDAPEAIDCKYEAVEVISEATVDLPDEPQAPEEGGPPTWTPEQFLNNHYENCVAEGETKVIVNGLPDVSGVYSTTGGNVSLEGWSLGDNEFFVNVGRCYLDDSHVFTTKAIQVSDTVSELAEDGSDAVVGGEFITVHFGMTGEGGPFAAVTREELLSIETTEGDGAVLPSMGLSRVTHNYSPHVDVTMVPGVFDPETFKGAFAFGSQAYNDRDFQPWTDAPWNGTPDYLFEILVFCK